jgi:fructose-1,6-bisphosphatase/inositol monophosphatase family enzyme
MVCAMTEPLHRTTPEVSTGLAESDANELLLVAGGAVDSAALLARLVPRALGVRTHGSAALDLAWLAAGRLGASLMLSNRAWDVSAGVLLAREAGGLAYDWDGSEHGVDSRFTIASAPSLKGSLLELLTAV